MLKFCSIGLCTFNAIKKTATLREASMNNETAVETYVCVCLSLCLLYA